MNFSVVIPAYNRANFIAATLDSILGQTHKPREVIVVDDGSSDATADVAAAYAPQVTVIRTVNAGSIVARNIGLRAASSRLVAFCDSDDLWRPEFLAIMGEVWQAVPDTKAAYCDFALVRDGVWEGRSKFADAPAGFWRGMQTVAPGIGIFNAPVVDRLVRFQPFFASCVVADRVALIEAGGWDEGVGRTVGDDFGTALRIAALTPIAVVFRTLAGIRKHDGNFSGDNRSVALGDSNVLEHVLRTRPALASLRPLILGSIAERRTAALHLAFADRDFAAVREIHGLLPHPAKSGAVRIKHAIASMPGPLRELVARFALALGTMRSELRPRDRAAGA